MSKKVYSVVLFEAAAEELGPLVALWIRRNEMGSYLYCTSVDPAGPYLHMRLTVSHENQAESEMELQIPHSFVKAIFYAADVKQLGFT